MTTLSPVARRPIVVLLVDDQRFVSMAVERLLAAEGDIELHYCADGNAAVAEAVRIAPAVILQDLVMPEVDGFTVVGLLRANAATSRTPIVVLSGNDDARTRERALAAGASDYLVKLPARDALVACIRRHAESGDAVTNVPTVAAIANAPGAAESVVEADTQSLDRSVLAGYRVANVDGGPDFAAMLIDQFIAEAGTQVSALRDAGLRRDVGRLKATAHSLKGSSMTLGAHRLGALCKCVENRAEQDPDAVASHLMPELEREFIKVRGILTAERQGVSQL